MTEKTNDQEYAIAEFQHAASEYVNAVDSEDTTKIVAARYALEMAGAECQLQGLDPSKITPEGYDQT